MAHHQTLMTVLHTITDRAATAEQRPVQVQGEPRRNYG